MAVGTNAGARLVVIMMRICDDFFRIDPLLLWDM